MTNQSQPPTPENQAAARDLAPERIYVHPTSAEWRSNKWPQEVSEYVEYVRADLLQQPASGERCVDAGSERRCVLNLIERFQREPKRSQGTINALEWLRRQIEEENHVYHAFQPASPNAGFCKEDECFRCGLAPNALMHMLGKIPATGAPDYRERNEEALTQFRGFQQGWDSYGGLPINARAIELATRLIPVLPEWQVVPRSDGSIQFDGPNGDEICIEINGAATGAGDGEQRDASPREIEAEADIAPAPVAEGERPDKCPACGEAKCFDHELRTMAAPAPVPVIEAPQGEQEVVFRWGKDADGYPTLVPTMESSTVTTNEAARETAIKLSSHFGLQFGEASLVQAAAIISKHFNAGAVEQSLRAEVEHWVNHYNELDAWRAQTAGINAQLRAELSTARNEIQRLESELTIPRCNECGAVLGDNWCADCAGRADREKLVDARANPIREALDKVWSLKNGGTIDITTGVMVNDPDGCWFTQSEIATALQSLLDKPLAESGVEVEKSDVDDERDDLTRDPMNVWAHGVSDMDFD